MAYSDIKDPSAHFQTMLWTGNASSNEITFDGNSDLQADWIWHKEPNDSNGWHQTDTSIGIANYLASESTAAEYGVGSAYVSAIGSNSITYGSGDSSFNSNSVAQATWAWKANGGTTASNTDGTITTTTQVNSDAGFSIVTWAGGGTGSLGHGLGEVPDMWIVKNRDYAVSWAVGFSVSGTLGGTSNYLSLNTDGATSTYNNIWGSSPVNSSTITMAGDRSVNISGNDYVAYFFKSKQGYSKFGKYVGNGSQNGPMVHTGFKPAFVIMKRSSGTGAWHLFDNKRSGYNYANDVLQPQDTAAELSGQTYQFVDFLSNGFKVRRATHGPNVSGSTYIYMAFAENPFVAGGVPTTAI